MMLVMTGLDYYLVYPSGAARTRPPEGMLVEELVLDGDWSAVRLESAGWSPKDGRWWCSAAFSRGLRVDPHLRRRVVGVDRMVASGAYERLGGGSLPAETTLRGFFSDGVPLPTAAPLRLGAAPGAAGFHETRFYRALFAGDLDDGGLARLRDVWGTVGALAGARRRVGRDAYDWELRRLAAASAWCVDLTAHLATPRADGIGPVLRDLSSAVRALGLIPVTVERFS